MKDRLKVAYFIDNFFPQVNGVVTSSINTCFEMKRRGHDIYAVAPQPVDMSDYQSDYFPYNLYFQKGFPAYFYPDFMFTYNFSNRVFEVIKEFSPDLIHFHAPFSIGYEAIRIAHKLDVPVVGTFHTFFAEPEYLKLVGLDWCKPLQQFGWWYSNMFFNRCDGVVSPGKATAQILLNKRLKSNLQIISNGVDVSKYRDFHFTDERFFDYKDDVDYIIYVGRISDEKGLDVLIKAMSFIEQKRHNTALVIVGGGPSIAKLKKLASRLDIADNIIFTGMIPNKNLLESGLLKKMKLFVTASTSENQPMTIIEAIAFGLPIVGVDAKGVPELIEDNGFIVKPNEPELLSDKILEILNNDELRARFSAKSIELANKYDIRNTTNSMEKFYFSLLSKQDIYEKSV